MGKRPLDTTIKYNLANPNEAVTQSYDDLMKKFNPGEASIFRLLKGLPNPLLPRSFYPENPGATTWPDYNKVIFPWVKFEILAQVKTQQQADEMLSKMAKAERADLDKLKDESIAQLQFVEDIKNEFSRYLSKETKQAIDFINYELLNPKNAFLFEAFTHGQVIDMNNPNYRNILQKSITKEIFAIRKLGFEEWKKQSELVMLFDTLQKTGMAATYVSDFIQSGNLTQTPSNMEYINRFIYTAYGSSGKIDDPECGTVDYLGKKYNVYKPNEYKEYIEITKANGDYRNESRKAMDCVLLEIDLDKENH